MIKEKTMRHIILLSLLITIITGCGFQLRGINTGKLPEQFQKTYLTESDNNKNNKNSLFYQKLKELIVTNGGNLSNEEQANVTVVLSPVTINSREIALANKGLLKEYERTYKVTVTILDTNNGVQLGSRVLTRIEDIQLSDQQVLASEEQIQITNKEAYRSLAEAAILYLQSF